MTHPLPVPAQDPWTQFSADPRRHPQVRASDADRDVVTEAVNAAFSDGRLDAVEHAERLQDALAAKRLGDLVPLLEDITIAARPEPPAPRAQRIRSAAISSWLGLAVLFNLIWIASWLFSSSAPFYYWPIWPMIGTGVPVLLGWIATARGEQH